MFPTITLCLKHTVNLNSTFFGRTTLLRNAFELTVPDLYHVYDSFRKLNMMPTLSRVFLKLFLWSNFGPIWPKLLNLALFRLILAN